MNLAETVEIARVNIDGLDQAIISLLRARAEISREAQALRRAAGHGGVVLSRETAIISQYSAGLGSPAGPTIALAVLALCRGSGFGPLAPLPTLGTAPQAVTPGQDT